MTVRALSDIVVRLTLRALRRLPVILPSHTDPPAVFLNRFMKFVAVGAVFLGLAVCPTSTFRSFAFVYWENLRQLRISIEKVLDLFLGLILVLSVAYSTGIATAAVLRRLKISIEQGAEMRPGNK
jgi:hypothetical protein